jgi:hypothetical protein
MVDRLVPFERVPDLPRILGIDRPLPKSNAAHGPRTGRESLSAQSLDTIRETYRRDAAVHALAGAHDADLFGTYAPPDAERATGTA